MYLFRNLYAWIEEVNQNQLYHRFTELSGYPYKACETTNEKLHGWAL